MTLYESRSFSQGSLKGLGCDGFSVCNFCSLDCSAKSRDTTLSISASPLLDCLVCLSDWQGIPLAVMIYPVVFQVDITMFIIFIIERIFIAM